MLSDERIAEIRRLAAWKCGDVPVNHLREHDSAEVVQIIDALAAARAEVERLRAERDEARKKATLFGDMLSRIVDVVDLGPVDPDVLKAIELAFRDEFPMETYIDAAKNRADELDAEVKRLRAERDRERDAAIEDCRQVVHDLRCQRGHEVAGYAALGKVEIGLRALWSTGACEHVTLREPLRWFAERMEEQLRANDHKPGWQRDTPGALHARILEEAEELRNATLGQDPARIIDEAADVANFAMMIADNARRPGAGEQKG